MAVLHILELVVTLCVTLAYNVELRMHKHCSYNGGMIWLVSGAYGLYPKEF